MNKRISKKTLAKILPFKDPFLLIDRVIFYDPEKRIVAQKYLTGKEWFLRGHFPQKPVMPGHLIAESMAQTCSLFFGRFGYENIKDKMFYLAKSKARFYKVVKPKDKIIITAYPVKIFSKAAIIKAEAHVNNKLVAKAEFTLAVKG